MKEKTGLKRLTACFMVVILFLTSAPLASLAGIDLSAFEGFFGVRAEAEDEDTEGVLRYTVENGEATVTGYNGKINGELVIPSTFGGYPVTSIGYEAFHGCTYLTGITIPDSVTSIGDYAFRSCDGLTSITIPDSVTSIGEDAFDYTNWYDSQLDGVVYVGKVLYKYKGTMPSNTSITIKDGTKGIADYVFRGCAELTNITIPDSVISIGNHAFSVCTGLTSISIPNSVISIGDAAFNYCTGLTSVEIPNSVTNIAGSAFAGCDKLERLTVESDNKVYHDENNCIIETASKTLTVGCKSSIIPSDGSVTSIGKSAFYYCTHLLRITIPDSVTSIDETAFSHCISISKITIPDSVTSIGKDAFEGCNELTDVTIGNSVTSIGDNAFSYCTGLTSITIPKSVTSLSGSAFAGCDNLKSLTVESGNKVYHNKNNCIIETESKTLTIGCKNSIIPSDGSVASIGANAFRDCYNLSSITIPDSVTSIGSSAFWNCVDLTSVTIPNRVTSIGSDAFRDCYKLTSVIIGSNVTSIGDSAFSGCTGLTNVTIPDSVTSIGGSAFYYCYSITSVRIGNGVTIIGDGAFSDCTGLTSVIIPDSVTSIGNAAFIGCTELISVTIGNSVTSIGASAFKGCAELTSVTIGNGVTSIGDGAFNECTELTSITIPNSVVSIGRDAFSNCIKMKSVTIGNSVTSIGWDAFENCRKLETLNWNAENIEDGPTIFSNMGIEGNGVYIVFGDTVKSIPECWPSVFEYEVSKVKSVIIGDGVTSIGNQAFERFTGLTSLTIGNSVTSIGNFAFRDCTGLTSVVIPNSVTSIGYNAFESCTGLKSIIIGNSVTSIGEDAFYGCTGMKKITIPDSVTDISNSAFSGCSRLTSVKIGDGVVNIGKWAFIDCINLKDLTIGGNVTSIGYAAFSGCSRLTSVRIPDYVKEIGEHAFRDCTSLIGIKIGERVEKIGYATFYNCPSLESVIIPNSVTSIDGFAFGACQNLKNVYYSGSKEQWEKISIDDGNADLKNAKIVCNSYGPVGKSELAVMKEAETWFTVYDSSKIADVDIGNEISNKSANLNLNDVTVKIDKETDNNSTGETKTFNKKFMYPQKSFSETTFTFSKDDYYKYIIPSEVTSDDETQHDTIVNVYMRKDKRDGKPYVSTVFVQQLDENGNPETKYKEAQHERIMLLQDARYNIIMTAQGHNAEKTEYVISQDDAHKISNKTGVFSNRELYSRFNQSMPVYAYVISDGVVSDPVSLSFSKENNFLNRLTTGTLDFFGPSGAKFTVPKKLPLLGGTEISTNFLKLPVGVQVQGTRVRISVGFDIFGFSESTDAKGNTETEWLNFKESCKTLSENVKDEKESYKKYTDFCKTKGYGRGKSKKKTINTDFMGYIEGYLTDNGIVFSEVCGAVAMEFAYKAKVQAGPFGAPLFYGYVEAGAEVGAEVKAGRYLPDKKIPVVFDVTVKVEPKITLGVGLGLEGVASGGAYAKGTMPVSYSMNKQNLKVQVNGEIGLEGHFLHVSNKVPLISGKFDLIDSYFGNSPSKAPAKFSYDSETVSESQATLRSRDYAENTKWNGLGKNSGKRKAKVASAASVSMSVLEESVHSSQSPKVELAEKGQRLAVWVEDDQNRDAYNRFKLVYLDFSQGASAEPKAVDDCGTNDYEPVLFTGSDGTYVAYQSFKGKYTTVDDNSVSELLEDAEIKVAKFNEETGSFENVRTLSDNDTYDYAPRLTSENGKTVVYWVNCNSKDYAAGSCSIMKSDMDGNTECVYSGLNYIYEFAVSGSDVYYTAETDSENETTNDLNLFKNTVQITANDGSSDQELPSALILGNFGGGEKLFYSTADGIYYVDGEDIKTVVEDIQNTATALQVTELSGKPTVVWLGVTQNGNELFSASYEDEKWSEAVELSEYGCLLSNLSLKSENGALFGMLNKTARESTDEGYVNGQTDLCLVEIGSFTDAEVLIGEFDEFSLKKDVETTISVWIGNKGTTTLEDVTFKITDTLGYSETVTKTLSLASGDSCFVELPYKSSELKAGTLKVEAIVENDVNSKNNTDEKSFGKAYLVFGDVQLEQVGGGNIITAVLTNKGKTVANDVEVLVKEEENTVSSLYTERLEPGQSAKLEFVVSSSSLTFDSDSGTAKITFVATTSSDQDYTAAGTTGIVIENHIHKFSEWTVTKEPSCSEMGEKARTCSLCGGTETQKLDFAPHTEVTDAAVPATCTEPGKTEGKHCSVCGAVIVKQEEAPALGHTEEDRAEIPATCTENGYTAGVYCTVCNTWLSGHEVIEAHHADEDGDGLCDFCGLLIVPAISLGETLTVDVAEGEIVYLRFVPEKSGTYAFTSNSGKDTYGYLFDSEKNVIASNDDGGENGDFKVEYQLTAGTVYYWGAKYYNSEDSGSFEVSLSMVCDHKDTEERAATAETCTENGYTAGVICLDCGEWISGHEVIYAHHTDENDDDICDVCGLDAPAITGDIYGKTKDTIGTYTVKIDGTVIFNGTGEMYDIEVVVLPDDYNIRKIIIGEGITSAGGISFGGTETIETVVLPGSLENVNENMFHSCTSLKNLTLTEGIKTIGEGAFTSCSALKNLTIPESVTSIGKAAFAYCSALENLTISSGVTKIGMGAFFDCASLKSVTVPSSVTEIGNYAFGYTEDDDDITEMIDFVIKGFRGTAAEEYANENGFDFENACSHDSSALENRPETLATCTENGYTAGVICLNCGEWVSGHEVIKAHHTDEDGDNICDVCGLEVPPVTGKVFDYDDDEIGTYSLRANGEMTIDGEGVLSVFDDSSVKKKIKKLIIKDGITEMDDDALSGCYALKEVALPETLTRIAGYAFRACTALTELVLPNSLTTIGDNAFNGCSSLTSMIIPESVTYLGNGIFRDCGKLESVTLPNSITSIGEYAFAGCAALTGLTLPSSLTSIGESAFERCAGLTEITIPGSVTSIDEYAFWGCSGLTSVTIGNGVKSIGDGAFEGCYGLTSIEIPDGVTKVGNFAFEDCANLANITIPDTVTSFGSGVFDNTAWYEEQPDGDVYAGKVYYKYKGTAPENLNVTIKDGTKGIANNAFFNCSELTGITIPDSVTNIERYAFFGCEGLTRVVIPNGVTTIESCVFCECTGLTSITIPDGVTSIDRQAFRGCTALTTVMIGKGLKFIREEAFLKIDNTLEIYYSGSEADWNEISIDSSNDAISCANLHYNSDFGHTHNYIETVTQEATCTVDGVKTFACECGSTYTVPIPAPGHTESSWITDKDSSCTVGGTKHIECKVCHATLKAEEIPVKAHTYEDVVTAPTCVTDGYTTHICKVCGNSYVDGKVTALGHTEVIEAAVPTTCTEKGKTEGKHCSVCGEVLVVQKDVPATGHTEVKDKAVAATCTENGKTEGRHCSVCGEVLVAQNDIPATDHTEVIDAAVPATCTKKGKTAGSRCSVCGEVIVAQKDISAKGHTEVADKAVAATCTKKGKTEGKHCSVCGEVIKAQKTVSALGHKYKTTTKKATTSKDGKAVTACTVCGKVKKTTVIYKASSVKLSKTSYTYNGKTQKPKITVKGSKGKLLTEGKDYTVKYPKGMKNPGTYTVTVTFKGNYSGKKTLTFTIAPKAPTLKVTAAKKSAKLSWNKQTGATGYNVYMATSKNGKYKKIATVKGNKVSYTKTGLTKGKTYYFKVAAYTTLGGKTINSAYSSVKSAKVK